MADEEETPAEDPPTEEEPEAGDAPVEEEAPPPDPEPEVVAEPEAEAPPIQEEGAVGPEPTAPPAAPGPPRNQTADPLNTEFLYYSTVLRIVGPAMTQEAERAVVIQWIKKLFRPEYQSTKLRPKRNRYLSFLTTCLLFDETMMPFSVMPPEDALQDLKGFAVEPVAAAAWETENTWQETLQNLPDNFQMLPCSIHEDKEKCKMDHHLDQILDQEFQLFLYIAKPYAALIQNGADRTRVGAWLQILCSIHGSKSCSKMKAIRNDYMMALLGYLQDLRAVGPFAENPSHVRLVPLAEAAKANVENSPITDPTGSFANDFLSEQPMPDDGAFCYIALSGELVNTNLAPH